MSSSPEAIPPHIARALEKIVAWNEETDQQSPAVEAGSSLSGDDAKVPTLLVSSAAYQCFVQAVDHLHAVHALLFTAEVLHPYAPYTLVRTAIENAATGIWILSPASRPERVRRCLKRAWENVRQGKEFMDRAGITPQPPARSIVQREQEIKDLAVRNGLDQSDVCGRWSTEHQIRCAGEALGDSVAAQSFWRICSGFAHGHPWASLSMLERAEHDREGNVVQLRLTGSSDALLDLTYYAAAMTGKARALFEERRCAPFAESGRGAS